MIDHKKILTNGVFCPMPWKGLMYNSDGRVKNCIRSAGNIGNLCDQKISDILSGDKNLSTQRNMLNDRPGEDCHTCYNLENGKRRFDIISDRIFYIKEFKKEPLDTYQEANHELKAIDVRWSNLCNFACVYCGPSFSSRWASEMKVDLKSPPLEHLQDLKQFVFSKAQDLQHVYLAGGEPLLMKDNLELLDLLLEKNSNVNLRINTNLSKVDTKVFEKICQFKNVHWTISVETQAKEFEYVRFGGSWQDFLDNLDIIKSLGHKISFNMLYFLLNFRSLFECVDFFRSQGFHPNSFIIGPLLDPLFLNVRHLPDAILTEIGQKLQHEINLNPGYLLEDSYRNLLNYIEQPFEKDLPGSLQKIREIDQRRGLDCRDTFKEIFDLT